ncbi:hypothetical protein EMCRGX_G013064 [Ephydatia muelleri]
MESTGKRFSTNSTPRLGTDLRTRFARAVIDWPGLKSLPNALLVKASSVNGQNNVNIYLYSVAVNSLLSLLPALTLLISTVTKTWVLGQTVCSLNQFLTYKVGLMHALIHVCISRERYSAVVHFSKWQPYSRRTYIHVAAVWIFAICSGVMGLVQGGQIVGKTDDILSCYSPNRWFDEQHLFPLVVVYLLSSCIFNIGSLAFSSLYYACTFKALYIVKENRVHPNSTEPTKLDQTDIPICWKAEFEGQDRADGTRLIEWSSIIKNVCLTFQGPRMRLFILQAMAHLLLSYLTYSTLQSDLLLRYHCQIVLIMMILSHSLYQVKLSGDLALLIPSKCMLYKDFTEYLVIGINWFIRTPIPIRPSGRPPNPTMPLAKTPTRPSRSMCRAQLSKEALSSHPSGSP